VGRRARNNNIFFLQVVGFAMMVGVATSAQQPTLARLNREAGADLPRASVNHTWPTPHSARSRTTSVRPESMLSRPATQALFVHSDLERARMIASFALHQNPNDVEALFVRMEVAAMEDDEAELLDASIRLCETAPGVTTDPRVQLAAARIRESAANTPAFRAAIPRIKLLLANTQQPWPDLHGALLLAAMDGAPGLNPYTVSRAAGILTDWRIVGSPAGRLAGNDDGVSHAGDLSAPMYQNHLVENFQFPDGQIVLPDYLPRHGMFYGAAHFASLAAATWRLNLEGSAGTEIYIDGRRVLRAGGASGHYSSTFDASSGPHRVLVAFAGFAAPLRVTITPASDEERSVLPTQTSLQELTYLLAGSHYAMGDFASAAKQIGAVPEAANSAALQFLLAQSEAQGRLDRSDDLAAWKKVHRLAPSALAADSALAGRAVAQGDLATASRMANVVLSARPLDAYALGIFAMAATPLSGSSKSGSSKDDLRLRQIAAHPSCITLQRAVHFYRAQGNVGKADSVQQKLDGCAPESLDYAKSLSEQGRHSESAQALQQLVSAAPLDRNARLMLVRELQLAGEDEAAQRAAVEWLHVAPNAAEYHRLAATVDPPYVSAQQPLGMPFYASYRRDISDIVREAQQEPLTSAAVLMEEHVAIARPDGSVSLYVHTVTRISADKKLQPPDNIDAPQEAQVLTLRIVHADGTLEPVSELTQESPPGLLPGDVIEQEYVLNYTGDGGISEHCEAFQFVFGNPGDQVRHARFVVLTPAGQSDRGVVIATGGAPEMTATIRNGMLQRVWDNENQQTNAAGPAAANAGSPIVRVVEEENGWATPSSAEHERRIETIHPGPRPEES
jgi:tetratricopeptide (TPR) repeat protein